MKKKSVYVAEDGKVFETENECLEYEMSSILKLDNCMIRFYDCTMRPLRLYELEELDDGLEHVLCWSSSNEHWLDMKKLIQTCKNELYGLESAYKTIVNNKT